MLRGAHVLHLPAIPPPCVTRARDGSPPPAGVGPTRSPQDASAAHPGGRSARPVQVRGEDLSNTEGLASRRGRESAWTACGGADPVLSPPRENRAGPRLVGGPHVEDVENRGSFSRSARQDVPGLEPASDARNLPPAVLRDARCTRLSTRMKALRRGKKSHLIISGSSRREEHRAEREVAGRAAQQVPSEGAGDLRHVRSSPTRATSSSTTTRAHPRDVVVHDHAPASARLPIGAGPHDRRRVPRASRVRTPLPRCSARPRARPEPPIARAFDADVARGGPVDCAWRGVQRALPRNRLVRGPRAGVESPRRAGRVSDPRRSPRSLADPLPAPPRPCCPGGGEPGRDPNLRSPRAFWPGRAWGPRLSVVVRRIVPRSRAA
jgi:hypothetical protein